MDPRTAKFTFARRAWPMHETFPRMYFIQLGVESKIDCIETLGCNNMAVKST